MVSYKKLTQIILFVFILSLIIYSCSRCSVVETTKYGVVKTKAAVSDRSGVIHYHTIIRGDDGKVYDKEGVNFYAVPEGNRVYWVEQEIKFK